MIAPESNVSPKLGACVAEHKTSASGFLKVIAIMLGSSAVGLSLLGLGIFGGDSNLGGKIVISILGTLFLLPAGLGGYGLARGRNNGLRFHEHGIAVHHAGADTSILWDDVDGYTRALCLTIDTNDDESIDVGIDGLRAEAEILTRVREEVVVRRAVPQLKAKLLAGETVELEGADDETTKAAPGTTRVAGFALDAKGITVMDSNRHLAWGELTGYGATVETRSAGKLMLEVNAVFIESATERFQIVINSLSERETLLGLCDAMGILRSATSA